MSKTNYSIKLSAGWIDRSELNGTNDWGPASWFTEERFKALQALKLPFPAYTLTVDRTAVMLYTIKVISEADYSVFLQPQMECKLDKELFDELYSVYLDHADLFDYAIDLSDPEIHPPFISLVFSNAARLRFNILESGSFLSPVLEAPICKWSDDQLFLINDDSSKKGGDDV